MLTDNVMGVMQVQCFLCHWSGWQLLSS